MPTNKRQWMREYMRKARKLGKIIHWREYQKKKQQMAVAAYLDDKDGN